MPVIPALGRKKDHEFEASLGYTERSCVKTNNSTTDVSDRNLKNVKVTHRRKKTRKE
jgi:hypothetical protein